MAVRTKEEIMQMIRERVGENTDDETIKFVEDVSDTLNDYDRMEKTLHRKIFQPGAGW